MDYNYNNPYPFGWSTSGPYIPNGYNGNPANLPSVPPAPTPHPGPIHPPPGFNLSTQGPVHSVGNVPVFNSNVMPNMRYSGMYPFGMSTPFPNNASAAAGNGQFPGNWNFGFQSGQLEQQNNRIMPNPMNSANGTGTNSDNVSANKKDEDVSVPNKTNDITDEVASKLSSLLYGTNFLQNAISKMQNKSDGEKSGNTQPVQPVQNDIGLKNQVSKCDNDSESSDSTIRNSDSSSDSDTETNR